MKFRGSAGAQLLKGPFERLEIDQRSKIDQRKLSFIVNNRMIWGMLIPTDNTLTTRKSTFLAQIVPDHPVGTRYYSS